MRIEPRTMDELTRAFLTVVADPDRVALLYTQLREFNHDIRNQLSLYRMKLYLARQSTPPGPSLDVLDQFQARYQALEEFVVRVQEICRPVSLTRMSVSLDLVMDEVQRRWSGQLARHGRSLQWTPPPEARQSWLDPVLLRDAFDSFVTWRATAGPAGAVVQARWISEPRRFRLVWDEPDGSPVGPPTPGGLPCLALALLGRVLAIHGGTLEVDDRNGFHLELSLPIEGPTPASLPGPDPLPSLAAPTAQPERPRSAETSREPSRAATPRPSTRTSAGVTPLLVTSILGPGGT